MYLLGSLQCQLMDLGSDSRTDKSYLQISALHPNAYARIPLAKTAVNSEQTLTGSDSWSFNLIRFAVAQVPQEFALLYARKQNIGTNTGMEDKPEPGTFLRRSLAS
jgi:hypothetical protein